MKSELKIPMHSLPPGAYEVLRLWTTPEGHTFARHDPFPNKEDEDPCHWGTLFALTIINLSEQIAKSMVPMSAATPAMDPEIVCRRILARFLPQIQDRFPDILGVMDREGDQPLDPVSQVLEDTSGGSS